MLMKMKWIHYKLQQLAIQISPEPEEFSLDEEQPYQDILKKAQIWLTGKLGGVAKLILLWYRW